MKNEMQVFFNDNTSICFEVSVKKTTDTFLKVHELQENFLPVFLEIEHHQINTMLELTKVYPYVLLYFQEEAKTVFKGAAFNLNKNEQPFLITTQYKKILILPYPIVFALNKVSHIELNKDNKIDE